MTEKIIIYRPKMHVEIKWSPECTKSYKKNIIFTCGEIIRVFFK